MKQSTKDKAKGKFHQVRGKVKETVGRALRLCNYGTEDRMDAT